MTFFFLIGLFFLVYLDASLLKQQDETRYEKIFKTYPQRWAFFATFLFIAVLPIYLKRRLRFKKEYLAHARETGISGQTTPLDNRERTLDATGMVIVWFVIVLFFVLFMNFSSLYFPIFKTPLGELIASAAFSSLLMVLLIFFTTRRYPNGFWGNVGMKKAGHGFLRLFFIPAVIGLGFAFVSASIIMTRQTPPSTPLNQVLGASDSSTGLLIFLGIAIVMAPFLEEIIFRGYFFNVLNRLKGTTFAVIFIGSVFALMHVGQYWGDWMAILIVGLLGFVLTMLRAWSGSTIASMTMHYIYNGFVTIIPVIFLIFSNTPYWRYQAFYHSLDAPAKESLLKEALKREPQRSEIYNDLAWLYAQEGKQFDEALLLVEEALRLDPDNAAYSDTKAEVFYHLGRYREAIEIEEELLKRFPEDELFKKHLQKFRRALAEIRKKAEKIPKKIPKESL